MFYQSSQQGVENHIIFSSAAQGLSPLNMWQQSEHFLKLQASVFGPGIGWFAHPHFSLLSHIVKTLLSYFCHEGSVLNEKWRFGEQEM